MAGRYAATPTRETRRREQVELVHARALTEGEAISEVRRMPLGAHGRLTISAKRRNVRGWYREVRNAERRERLTEADALSARSLYGGA